jgi:aminoglycoside phosphotransferase (APT) family kinase protein
LNHPPAEINVDEQKVRQLLKADCPSLADESIRLVDEGWDNFLFRVGDGYAVRLPRREVAFGLLLNEQRWLPMLASRLPLATPGVVHAGKPSELFPWPWSVVNWIPGETAENHQFTSADVSLLAATLVALHQPAPDDAPVSPFRGMPIRTKNEIFVERLHRVAKRQEIDAPRLTEIWHEACEAPDAEERVWLHGDLHPRNLVVRNGALVGLIDWGDLTGGDAACDLACAWLCIESAPLRQQLFSAYRADEALIRRARGWAVHLGLMLIDSGEPRHVPMGQAALDRVLADA